MTQAESIIEQIEIVLDKMRPFLMRDGGNIEFDHFDEMTGVVYVRMTGACDGCALAATDISEGVEIVMMEEVPGISAVRIVDQESSL